MHVKVCNSKKKGRSDVGCNNLCQLGGYKISCKVFKYRIFLMQLVDGGVTFVTERIDCCPKLTGKILEAICEVCVEGLGFSAMWRV